MHLVASTRLSICLLLSALTADQGSMSRSNITAQWSILGAWFIFVYFSLHIFLISAPSGDKELASHISQHGKTWPYWFRKMGMKVLRIYIDSHASEKYYIANLNVHCKCLK